MFMLFLNLFYIFEIFHSQSFIFLIKMFLLFKYFVIFTGWKNIRCFLENNDCKHLHRQIANLEQYYWDSYDNAKKINNRCICSWSEIATHVVQSHLAMRKNFRVCIGSLFCLFVCFWVS